MLNPRTEAHLWIKMTIRKGICKLAHLCSLDGQPLEADNVIEVYSSYDYSFSISFLVFLQRVIRGCVTPILQLDVSVHRSCLPL